MYVRDGKQMPEKEEGAAFFRPIAGEEIETGQVWGVSKNLLTHGFTSFGQDAVPFDVDAARERVSEATAETIPEVTIEGNPGRPLGTTLYDNSVWRVFALAGMAIGAYHGYKRNDSVGWAIGWGLLGGIVPIIVIPVALAQGIGKRKR